MFTTYRAQDLGNGFWHIISVTKDAYGFILDKYEFLTNYASKAAADARIMDYTTPDQVAVSDFAVAAE